MKQQSLYTVEALKPFCFYQDYTGLKRNKVLSGYDYQVNGYLITDTSLNIKQLTIIDTQTMCSSRLCLASTKKSVNTTTTILHDFNEALISAELKWIKYYLNVLIAHLSERLSAGELLIDHQHIRLLFSEALILITEIETLLNTISVSKFYCYIARCIHKALHILSKLAGGRAFLNTSLLDMLCTFQLINWVYLTKESSVANIK